MGQVVIKVCCRVHASSPARGRSRARRNHRGSELLFRDHQSRGDARNAVAGQSEMDGVFKDASTGQMAQQVRLSVTARSTVGSASTEAEHTPTAPLAEEILDITVDRPCMMCVRDTRAGWALFVAILNDPRSAAV